MMLAIVGFPDLEPDDRHWIESFRAAHDPQAARLSVHFTLVFPLDIAFEALEAEAAAAAESEGPTAFAINRADAVANAMGGGAHLCLVPDEGAVGISRLHDRLYCGALKPHDRPDMRYVPHLTVAATADVASAQRLAAALDLPNRVLRGTIGALDIVDVSASRVRSIATYPLRGGDG
jgi:2'-5' RNA ligase